MKSKDFYTFIWCNEILFINQHKININQTPLFFICGVVKFKTMKNYRFTSNRKNSKIEYKDFVRGFNIKDAEYNFNLDNKKSDIIKIELL